MPAFEVGRFKVRVARKQGRWAVSIDGADLPRWYMSEAQAAGGGLVEAQRLGRVRRDASPIEA